MSTSANFPGGRISVEVRIRTDIHPTIVGVPNDARVRVVRRIVVGIGRRETQTYACYERKAKAPPPKPCSDRSGAKAGPTAAVRKAGPMAALRKPGTMAA